MCVWGDSEVCVCVCVDHSITHHNSLCPPAPLCWPTSVRRYGHPRGQPWKFGRDLKGASSQDATKQIKSFASKRSHSVDAMWSVEEHVGNTNCRTPLTNYWCISKRDSVDIDQGEAFCANSMCVHLRFRNNPQVNVHIHFRTITLA